MIGIVYKSTGSWYTVKTENGDFLECRIKGKFRMKGIKSTNPIAVGDLVDYDIENTTDETTGVITTIYDRKNYIVRKSVNLSHQMHIIAYNIDTGEEVWRRQTLAGDAWNLACMGKGLPNCPKEFGPDMDYSASSIMIDLGYRDILVAGQKSGSVYGLNPDTGEIIWSTAVSGGGTQGGIHFGMAADGKTIYVPINDMKNTHDGKVWQNRKPGMHSIDAETGNILWSTITNKECKEVDFNCDPGVSAAVTAIPGAVVVGHLDGNIRIFDKKNGKLIYVSGETISVDLDKQLIGK